MPVSPIELIGQPVIISYLADPQVRRGQFRIENHGDTAAHTAVQAAWLNVGGRQRPLGKIFLFDVDNDQPLDPGNIAIPPGQGVTFLLGFPGVPYDERRDVAVGLRLVGGPPPIEAESPLRLIRRIPRVP